VSVLAATGHANEELGTHLRGALNLGWTVDELREALLQISGYAGFPAAHEALDVLSEIVVRRSIWRAKRSRKHARRRSPQTSSHAKSGTTPIHRYNRHEAREQRTVRAALSPRPIRTATSRCSSPSSR
jgi:hypothetical protein